MNRRIKFTVIAKRWFDRVNGNTYHSVHITRTRDSKTLYVPFTYGYDSCYEQTTVETMADNKWLPVKYRNKDIQADFNIYRYNQQNNYPIEYTVIDVSRKKDL